MESGLCFGKTKFTKNGAEKFVKGGKMSRVTKKKLRIYFHKYCNAYHLTTQIEGEYE